MPVIGVAGLLGDLVRFVEPREPLVGRVLFDQLVVRRQLVAHVVPSTRVPALVREVMRECTRRLATAAMMRATSGRDSGRVLPVGLSWGSRGGAALLSPWLRKVPRSVMVGVP